MPYYEQQDFAHEMQQRQSEDAYWERVWQEEYEIELRRLQEMAEFPLFYWKETCRRINNEV